MTFTPLRLLLVEDEALIAMMAEDLIEELGHRVVLSAATVREAHGHCDRPDFDAALLDVNLNGESSMEIATRLAEIGCPFGFTTGYGSGGIDAAHRGRPVLTKPYAIEELRQTLNAFAAQLAGTSSITSSVDSKRG